MKRNKIIALTLAGAVAGTALLSGTLAWRSMNQQARNEALIQANPGGRLHDDFNGMRQSSTDTNVKNVYVENFTEKNDGAKIYARIRLDEYLELGTGAGGISDTNEAVSIITTNPDTQKPVTLEDESTWVTYKWNEDSLFRQYVTINTGGKTTYLPTYNQNKDSIDADINGTLAGSDGTIRTRMDAYEDYEEYPEGVKVGGVVLYDADEDAYDELRAAGITAEQLADAVWDSENDCLRLEGMSEGQSFSVGTVTCKAYEIEYDSVSRAVKSFGVDLDKDAPLDGSEPDGVDIQVVVLDEEDYHESQPTLETAKFISITEWKNLSEAKKTGNYWVYDTEDGWVYWASPIEPQTATGCLINSIACANKNKLSGEYYYGLNVVAQFATAGDWGSENDTETGAATGFYKEHISEDALLLLETIAQKELTAVDKAD